MPDWLIIFEFVVLVVLILLSGVFSGAEIALFSLNKIKIKKLAEDGNKNAILIEDLLSRPNRLLATILIGNNLINISAAAIATSLAIKYMGSKGIGLATGLVTLFVLIFGEITPKGIATKNAEKISLFLSRPIYMLVKVSYPLVKLLTLITRPLINLFGGESKSPFITEGEIKMLVELGEREGVIEKEEKEMIKGIFEFGETTAKEVMVPRIDMRCIEANKTISDAIKLVLETGHSRIPVYEGSIDNIIGILYTKDIFNYLDKMELQVKHLVRTAYFVPESKKLDEILREMQDKKIQIAIVVDEYGGVAGLLTLEDVIEEIVGEIWEEHEVVEKPIQEIDSKSAIVLSTASIEDVNEALGLYLPEGEFETIGGLFFNALGKVPVVGDVVEINGVKLIVEKMRGRRILSLKVIKEA